MAISALEIDGLRSIDLRVNAIRRRRAQSAYEPDSPSPEQLGALLRLVEATLPAARKWLAAKRPGARLAPWDRRPG